MMLSLCSNDQLSTDMLVSSTSYYSVYMTQYKLNLYNVTDDDIAQYRYDTL